MTRHEKAPSAACERTNLAPIKTYAPRDVQGLISFYDAGSAVKRRHAATAREGSVLGRGREMAHHA